MRWPRRKRILIEPQLFFECASPGNLIWAFAKESGQKLFSSLRLPWRVGAARSEDFSEIKLESRKDRITANDGGTYDLLRGLAGAVNGGAVIDGIE